MSLGTELNNPFDLRPDSRWTWHGEAREHEQGFCRFDTLHNGLRAGFLDLRNTVRAGFSTLREFVLHYAPPDENDTANYLDGMCHMTGWGPDAPLMVETPDQLQVFGRAVLVQEQGMSYASAIEPAVFQAAALAALMA